MHKMDILIKSNMNNRILIGGLVYYEFFALIIKIIQRVLGSFSSHILP